MLNLFNPIIETKIILPSKDKQDQPIAQEYIDRLLINVAETFGGFTLQTGKGGWILKDGTLQKEEILIVTISGQKSKVIKYIKSLALTVKSDLRQEAVYIAIENKVQFI